MASAPAARIVTKTVGKTAPLPGPRRRPENGGYARGDEVRNRILLAAIELFGEQGFASASTRAIAARAGVNPPALQYYFHNKARLHQACGQYIVDRITGHLSEPMARAAEVLETGRRPAVPEVMWGLLESVVDHSSSETEVPGWTRFLAQAAVEATDTSLALIHSDAVQPLVDIMAALIAVAWGRSANDEPVRLAAVLLLSQARAFGIQRTATLAMMDWPDFEGGRLETAKCYLRTAMNSVLSQPRSV